MKPKESAVILLRLRCPPKLRARAIARSLCSDSTGASGTFSVDFRRSVAGSVVLLFCSVAAVDLIRGNNLKLQGPGSPGFVWPTDGRPASARAAGSVATNRQVQSSRQLPSVSSAVGLPFKRVFSPFVSCGRMPANATDVCTRPGSTARTRTAGKSSRILGASRARRASAVGLAAISSLPSQVSCSSCSWKGSARAGRTLARSGEMARWPAGRLAGVWKPLDAAKHLIWSDNKQIGWVICSGRSGLVWWDTWYVQECR